MAVHWLCELRRKTTERLFPRLCTEPHKGKTRRARSRKDFATWHFRVLEVLINSQSWGWWHSEVWQRLMYNLSLLFQDGWSPQARALVNSRDGKMALCSSDKQTCKYRRWTMMEPNFASRETQGGFLVHILLALSDSTKALHSISISGLSHFEVMLSSQCAQARHWNFSWKETRMNARTYQVVSFDICLPFQDVAKTSIVFVELFTEGSWLFLWISFDWHHYLKRTPHIQCCSSPGFNTAH